VWGELRSNHQFSHIQNPLYSLYSRFLIPSKLMPHVGATKGKKP
jgi:hypothetical protein